MRKICFLFTVILMISFESGCVQIKESEMDLMNSHVAESDEVYMKQGKSEFKEDDKESEISESADIIDQEENYMETDIHEPYEEILNDLSNVVKYRISDTFQNNWPEKIEYSDSLKKALEMHENNYVWDCMIVELPMSEDAYTFEHYGYILYDINSDGIEELFFVRADHSIAAIFTYSDNEIVLVTAFWPRYRGVVSSDGLLLTTGSNGAMDNRQYAYSVAVDGTLIPEYGVRSESNHSTDPVSVNYYKYENDQEIPALYEEYEEVRSKIRLEQRAFWLIQEINPLPNNP